MAAKYKLVPAGPPAKRLKMDVGKSTVKLLQRCVKEAEELGETASGWHAMLEEKLLVHIARPDVTVVQLTESLKFPFPNAGIPILDAEMKAGHCLPGRIPPEHYEELVFWIPNPDPANMGFCVWYNANYRAQWTPASPSDEDKRCAMYVELHFNSSNLDCGVHRFVASGWLVEQHGTRLYLERNHQELPFNRLEPGDASSAAAIKTPFAWPPTSYWHSKSSWKVGVPSARMMCGAAPV